jgi:hypothetical protein
MSFVGKSLIASFFNTISGGLLNFGGISVTNLNNPSTHSKIIVQASTMLRPSQIRTYSTFQKNAASREYWDTEYKFITANSILANLMKDYYGGTITLIGDPYIRANDIIYIDDVKKDMWGMIGVEEIHHMFSKETGFVTTVVPDLETTIRMNPTSESPLLQVFLHSIDVISRFAAARQFINFGKNIFGSMLSKKTIESAYSTVNNLGQTSTNVAKEVAKEGVEQLADTVKSGLLARAGTAMFKPIKATGGKILKFVTKSTDESLLNATPTTLKELLQSNRYRSAITRGIMRATSAIVTAKLMKMFPTPFTNLSLKLGEFYNTQPINCIPLMSRGQLFIANLEGISREERSFDWMQSAQQYIGSGMSETLRSISSMPQSIYNIANNVNTNIKNTFGPRIVMNNLGL